MRLILITLVLLGQSLFLQASEDAKTMVQSGVKELVDTIVKYKTESDVEARDKAVKEIFIKYFDAPRMAATALGGPSWKGLTKEQKPVYVDVFTDFILSFYSSKMSEYDNNAISYGSVQKKSSKKVVVHSSVEYNGSNAKVLYSVVKTKKGWKIYDIEIEGVRMTTSYRGQLNELKRKGFDAMIDGMKKVMERNKTLKPEKVQEK